MFVMILEMDGASFAYWYCGLCLICLEGGRDLLHSGEGRMCGGESDLWVGSDMLVVAGVCGSLEARPELDAAVVFTLSRTVARGRLLSEVGRDFLIGGGSVMVGCSDAGSSSGVVIFGGGG